MSPSKTNRRVSRLETSMWFVTVLIAVLCTPVKAKDTQVCCVAWFHRCGLHASLSSDSFSDSYWFSFKEVILCTFVVLIVSFIPHFVHSTRFIAILMFIPSKLRLWYYWDPKLELVFDVLLVSFFISYDGGTESLGATMYSVISFNGRGWQLWRLSPFQNVSITNIVTLTLTSFVMSCWSLSGILSPLSFPFTH